MKKLKVNTKKYPVKVITELTIKQLLPLLQRDYNDWNEFHKEPITDKKHIQNYFKQLLNISLCIADVDYIIANAKPINEKE